MKLPLRIIVGVLSIVVLIAVRFFETSLFYDPLIAFFKGAYTESPLPEMDTSRLVLHLLLRFCINTLLSLLLLWVLFLDKKVIQFAMLLYVILGLVFTVIFLIVLHTFEIGIYQSLFYVRRFLIQPLFLLLLVPAFYFHKKTSH